MRAVNRSARYASIAYFERSPYNGRSVLIRWIGVIVMRPYSR